MGKTKKNPKEQLHLIVLSFKQFELEYRFHETRMWRFDYAIPSKKIAVEYEGIGGRFKSRHTTIKGYTGDCEKYNEAQMAGWIVLRYTPLNFMEAIENLERLLGKS